MCGIVGYVGEAGALPAIVDGLKRLEYRGYDSAGIAFQNGKGIEIYKTEGKIKELQRILPYPLPDVRAGLGHTRWATHGAPTARNAHPHSVEGVVVVHNGIIENYRELKSHLVTEGHRFTSDTDTEVIPQMIAKHMKRGLSLREAIEKTVAVLRGTYALGIMSETSPGVLFAVRKGSPLVIGLGERKFVFASDIPAILPYTKKVVFLEDDHICTLSAEGIRLEHLGTEGFVPLEDKIVEVDLPPSIAEKDGYQHFMLKEIFQQPQSVSDTFREWVGNPDKLANEVTQALEMPMGPRRLQIVACGTSYHAGLIGKYMIESLARIPVDVGIASEYRYMNPIFEKGSLFVSITQSGETADTLAAQKEAKERGAKILTICNVVGSTSAREADHILYTRAGPEIGVASTKAFTSQLAALCLLAFGLSLNRGRLTYREANALKSHLLDLPVLIDKVLQKNAEIEGLARTLTYAKDFLYLARGINYPIALEGALKLKEVSYIHAEGYPAGEMKHGPIALIEEGLPVLVVAFHDRLFEKMLSNIEEVKARGGRVIAVTDRPDLLSNKADDVIEVPSPHPVLSPFISVIPLQLLAYHLAVLRGCDVDQPRNLAKSVTVE